MRSAVILGARGLGGTIAVRLLKDGWRVASVARSDETLTAVAERGALALKADAAKPRTLSAALEVAVEEHGGLDLVVNAIRPQRPPQGSPRWGGPLETMDPADLQGWGTAAAEQAYVFLNTGIRALRAAGGGTLVQIVDGAATAPAAGRGAWAAGCAAVRALVLSAHEELRDEPVHPCLLAVHGTLEGEADREEVAASVAHLAEPRSRLAVPELHLR